MPHSRTIFQKDGLAVFAAFIMLGAVYAALFFRLYPCVPWNCDDWTYLGLFHSILPSTARWNPARVFQEFFMPLAGHFAAYVLRPLCGLGYLEALTLTCSGLAATAWFALSVCVYRFFFSAARERVPALCGLILFNAGLFLTNALRLPLVISEPAPSILFAYDLPNIFNAALALALFRAILNTGDTGDTGDGSLFATPLSHAGARQHATALACGLLIAYFTQFSMTISSAIAAIPAGSLLLFRLIRHVRNADGKAFSSIARQCTFLDLFCGLLVAFWFIAACLDLNGGRFAMLSLSPEPVSAILAMHFRALYTCIPPWIWLTLILLIMTNATILARDGKRGARSPDNDALRTFLGVMGLSFVLLLTLHILIFYVTNIGLDNRYFFGWAFYVYITLVVNALFLHKRFPPALVGLLPLPALLLANAALADPWMPRPMFYAEHRKAVVQAWLDDIREADRAGEAEVVIRTPTEAWPHPKDYLGDRLARTLYHHGITSRHMTIYQETLGKTQ
jgi:hypothetical protein